MIEPLLSVENLTISFGNGFKAVDNISFTINAGESFALVGESGSGKSLTALSILKLLPQQAQLSATAIKLKQTDLLPLPEFELCRIRGKRVSFIFQDPMSSLNPVMTIGEQIAEVLKLHTGLDENVCRERVLELLEQVEIPDPEQKLKAYPHQLSGGQRQRIMIAIALAGEPDLLIADEPTTALDVTIQAQILALLKKLQQQSGMTLWLISHDLALVSMTADRVAVMQQGKIVESGPCREVFKNPGHEYTQKLLQALPSMQNCPADGTESNTATLLQVSDFYCYYPIRKGVFQRVVDYVKAVDGVSFNLARGRTLALVGESGCGKTTLGKSLLGLIKGSRGLVKLDQADLGSLSEEQLRQKRAEMQIIFQDPYSAMNPRMLVGDIIAEGIQSLYPQIGVQERSEKVTDLLSQVGLPADSAMRYPHEFSGGQRQRICIARALAVEPKLIVCDEPTSALDVSVQAQIIELLKKLQQEKGLSYLFITHNIAVVAEIAQEVAVMYKGKIIEHGSVRQVLKTPQQAYTRKLLSTVPELTV